MMTNGTYRTQEGQMGRVPSCSKVGLHRGSWTAKEDALLTEYIQCMEKEIGALLRCGKSCILRWMNYLRSGIKRGDIGPDEDDLIIRLQALLGNWLFLIAGRLPGQTDNEIKNYWNSHLSKKLRAQGIHLREGSSKGTSRLAQRKNKKAQNNSTENEVDGKEDDDTGFKIHTSKLTRIRPKNYKSESRMSIDPRIENPSCKEIETRCQVHGEDSGICWSSMSESENLCDKDGVDHVLACGHPSKDEDFETLP